MLTQNTYPFQNMRVRDSLKNLNSNKNMNTRGKEAGVAQGDSDITITT